LCVMSRLYTLRKLWLLKGEAFNPVRICSNGPGFRVCVRTRSVSAGVSRDVSSLRDSPLNLSLPGTEVAGYRLCRPCGTILLRPVNDTAIARLGVRNLLNINGI
jgi:hypothetical protein